jgi:hypothetical protein
LAVAGATGSGGQGATGSGGQAATGGRGSPATGGSGGTGTGGGLGQTGDGSRGGTGGYGANGTGSAPAACGVIDRGGDTWTSLLLVIVALGVARLKRSREGTTRRRVASDPGQ